MSEPVKGYKVFRPDWTCAPNGALKQYTCPGKFEEDAAPVVCERGMHFCKMAADCFDYYKFDPKNKVAEVLAYGSIEEDGNKCCTDKLEIVREIPWAELLTLVNTGKCCTGYRNSGGYNSGNYNSGNRNSGNYNSGNRNSGDYNRGYRNSSDYNSGNYNSGNRNSGDYNIGNYNSGNCNSGNYNSGNRNSGNRNSGNYNSGNRNSGDYNSGNYNSGDYNSGNYNSGCFNTTSPKIRLFNRSSPWTYEDWINSKAYDVLAGMPAPCLTYIALNQMTKAEIAAHPEAKTTEGYLKTVDSPVSPSSWWQLLPQQDRDAVTSLPNFDARIFCEITGIDVDRD